MKTGDKVHKRGQEIIGEVIELTEKNAVIAFGQLLSTISLKEIEKIESSPKETGLPKRRSGLALTLDYGERRLSFKQEIDLRGVRTEERFPVSRLSLMRPSCLKWGICGFFMAKEMAF